MFSNTSLGMPHIVEGFQFYLHTTRLSTNGINHPYLPYQPKLVLIYRPRRNGTLSWRRHRHGEWTVCPEMLCDGYRSCYLFKLLRHRATGAQRLLASNPWPLGPWVATLTTGPQIHYDGSTLHTCMYNMKHWRWKVYWMIACYCG